MALLSKEPLHGFMRANDPHEFSYPDEGDEGDPSALAFFVSPFSEGEPDDDDDKWAQRHETRPPTWPNQEE